MNIPDKIYKNIDFRNNKLLKAKTNTPEHKEHIVNKEYVDTSNTYDTQKVNQLVNPIKLDWVSDPKGKNIKEILDDVFFPLLLPDYEEPNFINVQLNLNTNRILFYETLTTFSVKWKSVYNDRLPQASASVIVTDNSVVNSFNGSTNSEEDSVSFDFSCTGKLSAIDISRTYKATSITKYTSYNEPYVPVEMTVPKTITFDLLELMKSNGYLITNPILYCAQSININNLNQTTDFTITNGSIKVLGGNTVNNKIYLLIPETLKGYDCYIDNQHIDLDRIFGEPTKKLINSSKDINNNYLVYSLDLGWYQSNKELNIEFLKYADETNNI